MSLLNGSPKYARDGIKLNVVERIVAFRDLDGSPLSYLDDEEWVLKSAVFGGETVFRVNVSEVPESMREAFYITYLSPDSDFYLSKMSTIRSKLSILRSILKQVPDSGGIKWFTVKSVHGYINAVKGKLAFSTLEQAIVVYTQMIIANNDDQAVEASKLNIYKLAKKHCNQEHSERKQTFAMPIGIASKIMGNALELFHDAVSSLPEIKSLIEQSASNHKLRETSFYEKPIDIVLRTVKGTPWCRHAGDNLGSQNVGALLTQTIAACHNLLMAFSGMRIHELNRVHNSSFKSYEEDGFVYHTITAETSKLESGGDVADTWICAEICGDILNFIAEIKQAAQIDSGSIRVSFKFLHKCEIRVNESWFSRSSAYLVRDVFMSDIDYVEFCQLNRGRERDVLIGDRWPLKSHQWRRTFATMALRFDLATLPAIKRQFKHVSMQMTEWYANYARITRNEDTRVDAELNKLIYDVQTEMAADVLYLAYNGNEPLAGGKGSEIQLSRESGSVPEVYKDRSAIVSMLSKRQINLNYAGLTYCTNGYKCDQDGVVNSAFCVECSSAIIDVEIAKKWKKLHERCVGHLEFAYDCGDMSPVSYAHFVSQIRAAEKVMLRCGLDFTPFKDLE